MTTRKSVLRQKAQSALLPAGNLSGSRSQKPAENFFTNPYAATVIIFCAVALGSIVIFTSDRPPKWKEYQDVVGNFTIQYPYAAQVKGAAVTFSGFRRGTKWLEVIRYEGVTIDAVIAEREKLSPFTIPGATVTARDIKVNTCTFRKIDVALPDQKPSAYYFLDRGQSTIFFELESIPTEREKIIEQMVNSITCG